jgi:hypothetical protein
MMMKMEEARMNLVKGDDDGMEEFQHDSLPDPEIPEGKGQEESSGKGNFSQPASSSNRKSGNGKVASWVSLFQNEEESLGSYASEIGQYSCVDLLREIEALELDADDEIHGLSHVDVEMMELPEELCSTFSENLGNGDLPSDLYVQEGNGNKEAEVVAMGQEKKTKSKCGPVLVEARPTRVTRDERTMMEKAQKRKMKANLEGNKGTVKTHNPSLLCLLLRYQR